MNEDDRHDNYCRTCGRALTRLTAPDGTVSYFHDGLTRTDDHEIVRVPLREVENPVMYCDFCGAQRPEWSYLTADVHVAYQDSIGVRIVTREQAEQMGLTGPGTTGSASGRWWAACDDCGQCLDGGFIDALITRATGQFPPKQLRGRHLIELRATLRQMYEPVFTSLSVKMPLGLGR